MKTTEQIISIPDYCISIPHWSDLNLTKEDLEGYRTQFADEVALATLLRNKKRAISYAFKHPMQATKRMLTHWGLGSWNA